MPAKRPLNDPFLTKVNRDRDRPSIPIVDVEKHVQREDAAFYLELLTDVLLVVNYGAAKSQVPVSAIATRTPFTNVAELLSSPTYQQYDRIVEMFRNNRIGTGMTELFEVLIRKWFEHSRVEHLTSPDPKTLLQRSGSTYYDLLPLSPDQVLMLRSWVSEDQIWQVILGLRQATGTLDRGTSETTADTANRLVAVATAVGPTKRPTRRRGDDTERLSEILQAKTSIAAFFRKFKTRVVKYFVDSIEVDVEATASSSGIAAQVGLFFKAIGRVIGIPRDPTGVGGIGVSTIPGSPAVKAAALFFELAGEISDFVAETKVTAIATVRTRSKLFELLSDVLDDKEQALNTILDNAVKDKQYSKEAATVVKRHFDFLGDTTAEYIAGYRWNFFQWCELFMYQLDKHLDLTIQVKMDISYSGARTFAVTGHSFASNHRDQVFANFTELMQKLSLPRLEQTVHLWQTWYLDLFALADPRQLPTDLGTRFVLVYTYDDKRSGDLRGSKTYIFSSALVYRPSQVAVTEMGTRTDQIFAGFMQEWLKDDRSGTEYKTFSRIAAGVGRLPPTPVWPLIDRSWAQGEPASAPS